MSWMDSWSRPSKSQATPAPFYLLNESTPYCHSCGRVIGNRKQNSGASAKTAVKYCSTKCRARKPGKLDREIEATFVKFLTGAVDEKKERHAVEQDRGKKSHKTGARKQKKTAKYVKGDPRILVSCTTVNALVFRDGSRDEENSASPRSKSPEVEEQDLDGGHKRLTVNDEVSVSHEPGVVDVILEDVLANCQVDYDVLALMSVRSGTRIRPPQSVSEVNGSIGGEKGWAERIEETEDMLEKRRLGQRRANEMEMVKCAARRGVVFGFVVDPEAEQDGSEKRFCEAVMNGKVVEPSYAKGDWGIRWRE